MNWLLSPLWQRQTYEEVLKFNCVYFRYKCQYFGSILNTDLYFWIKSVSDQCCLHCDGTVYKADTTIDSVVEDDDCGTIQKTMCIKNDQGETNFQNLTSIQNHWNVVSFFSQA